MKNIAVEKADRITTIILNRPDVKNAIDGPTAKELAEAFHDFDRDPECDVAILWGQGGCFCSGADLSAISNHAISDHSHRVAPDGNGPLGPTRMLLSKPVIAAISGYAVAGGLELALWCDLRVVERSATLGVFCRRWGVPLMDGGTVRLARLIGLSRALDLILTGRSVSAEEALAFGLVNRIVENGKSRPAAMQLALELSRFPQSCLRHDRLSIYEQSSLSLPEALSNEFRHGLEVLKSGEPAEGASRFVRSRKH